MKKSRKITLSAIFCSLVAVCTLLQIPTVAGYINLGDVAILVSACLIGNLGILSASIGAGLIDILTGYSIYLPATIIIKGLMAFICSKILHKKSNKLFKYIIIFIICEIVMIIGYFLYEIFVFDIGYAVSGLLYNCIQGAIAVVGSSVSMFFINKSKFMERM